MKKIISILLALSMLTLTVASVCAAELPFSDVKKSDWFYNDVKTAYESGVINGKSATEYKPSDNMTYAEAIKLAACMHMLAADGEIDFKPSEPWYKTYVDYCTENKIISKEYEYNKNASRSGYMTIFANCLPDNLLKEINAVADGSIPDVPSSAAYADAVYKLYRAGIVTGVDADHNCNPNANIKRSEVAAILTRMNDKDTRVEFSMGETENNNKDNDSGKDNDKDNNTEKQETVKPLSARLAPTEAVLMDGDNAEFIVTVSGGKAPYTYNWKVSVVASGAARSKAGGKESYYLTDDAVSDFPKAAYGDGTISFFVTKSFFGKYKSISCEVKDAEGTTVATSECTLKYGGNAELLNDLTEDNVLMYVEGKTWIDGRGLVVNGRIISGNIKTGDAVKIVNSDGKPITATIDGIEMFRKSLDEAKKNDNVGLLLGGLGNDKDTVLEKVEQGAAVCGYNDKYVITDVIYGIFTPNDGVDLSSALKNDNSVNIYYGNASDRNAFVYDSVYDENDNFIIDLELSDTLGVWYIGQNIKIRKDGKELGNLEITYIPDPWWLD